MEDNVYVPCHIQRKKCKIALIKSKEFYKGYIQQIRQGVQSTPKMNNNQQHEQQELTLNILQPKEKKYVQWFIV